MSAMNEKDYYEVLGVSKDATTDEIRRAFQKKARTLHPDVNKEPDAEERFKEVSEAYAVLSDDAKRARYDSMRSGNPFASAGYGNAGYGGVGYGGAGYGGGVGGWPFGGMGGMGGWPFGGASTKSSGRAYKPRAGADVVVEIDLDAEQAKNGCQRGIKYNRYETCGVCSGKGTVHSEESCTCPTCGGTGHMTIDLASILGFGAMTVVCPECEGSGRVVSNPCDVCGGSGRKQTVSEITVDIPAGSHDGDEIRVEGKGNAGTNGSSTGAFVARVGVASERVSPGQASALSTLGFCLPFVLLNIIQGQVYLLTFIIALAIGASVWSFFRYGGFGSGATWWKNAGKSLMSGAVHGSIFAIIAFLMFSCTSGMAQRMSATAQHAMGR